VSNADRIARPDWRHRRAADRVKAFRQRERDGRAIVGLEIELKPVTEYLVNAELLRLDQIEDRQAIGAAIRKLLDLLIAAEHLRP
jgi:hypothetical protein